MNRNLKLIVNNNFNKYEDTNFFEKKELKIILDLYARMVSQVAFYVCSKCANIS